MELNHLEETVSLFNIALGDQSGKADLKFWDPNNCGKAQIEPNGEGKMRIARLDDFSFERIDFIKIDVESFEYNLLLGATETLKKHYPTVFIEIFPENFDKVNTLLEEYGDHKQKELSPCNYFYVKGITD